MSKFFGAGSGSAPEFKQQIMKMRSARSNSLFTKASAEKGSALKSRMAGFALSAMTIAAYFTELGNFFGLALIAKECSRLDLGSGLPYRRANYAASISQHIFITTI